MGRKLSLLLLPLLAIAGLSFLIPNSPEAQKAIEKVARTVSAIASPVFQSEQEPIAPYVSPIEKLAVPTVTVGAEYAQLPEVRIWAIRNNTTYGWIQLPRGTVIQHLREDGDYIVARYEETILRVHRTVIESGALVAKRMRTYAVAY